MNKLAVTPFAQDSQTHGSAPGRQQLLQQLAQLWQQGATEACFSIARQLTSEFPKEGIAWKILGGLLQQRGDLQGAGEALAQAVKLLKKDAEVFLNAANVAAQLGDVTLATKHYRQAIRLNPSMTRAYANLASLLKEAGQQKEAEKLLRTALQLNKRDALVLFDLAALLHESGKSLEAVQYYRQALEIEPDNAVLAYNMAQVLFVLGNLDEALVHFQRAIDLNPTYFDALHQYGQCLRQKNRFKEAEQVWLQARVLNPESWQLLNDLAQLYKQLQQPLEYEACAKAIMQVKAPEIEELNNFTSTLINQQLLTEAERYCKQAMSLGIEDPFTYCNMALLLYYKQEYAQSLEYYEKALQLKPDCAAFWSNYSVSLRLVGEVERARQALEKAIALDPEYLDSYINLGSAYLEQGDVKLAVETYVKLIARAPHLDKAYRNLLYTNSFANELSPKEHLKYARACGEQFMAKAAPFKNWLVNAQDQRLRIGLVSADLRSHPVGYFLEHWLKHIDAGKTEIYAYSADGREDNYSQVLKKYCTQWRSLAGMNDARAASLIREDGIHILLDLSGYTADSRVSLFAWRPAPVQASWLGYWDTTGLPTMDAVIADPVSVPAGSEGQFTESVVKLPHTRLCFSAPDSNEQVNPLPALQNGYVTFGCFQKYSKVSDEVLAVWAQVFLALPAAKLYWQCKAFQDDQIQAEALARLQQAGIQTEQCVLMRPTARDAYFKNYHAVDMILDSFPFNGGTTTCEALWMGVPTLTMPGETMISRQGASMMTSAGLPEWVAEDKKAFVKKAIQFAADLPALANLRAGLRAQVMRSPLMDGERFARDMEQLLWNVWSERVTGIADALLAKTRIQDAYAGEDPVWIISATRASEEAFWASSALGVSLKRHMQQDARIVPYVYYENTRGLSEVFNEAVAIAPDNALVIFAHDDIWLDQNPFVQTVMDGLAAYDVIGVAGTARMLPKQPAWLFTDLAFTWEQSAFLRGKVAHSEHPFGHNTYFGAEQGDCVLMDGVFMAAYKRTLTQANVRHDPQFDFEFYDLDFCRTATQAGLKLGIWPISLTHQSMGNFGKQRWRDKYQMYLRKWGEGEAAVGTPMTAELGAALEEVFTLALQHQQAGDLQTATQLYQEILAVAPQSAPAWFNLGLIAWAQGHQQEAVACFAQAHAAQPAEWEYLQHYLVAMHATASADTLAATFEQAMALPQHAEAVHQLAEALKMPGFTRQSGQHAQASSQDAAMQPDAAQQQALLTAFEQQQYGQMEQALHTYLGQYPQWLAGWKMLADVLMLQKKDASAAAKQALTLNAQDPQEHCYYGIVLKAKGDLPGAATAFQQAIALKSDYAAAYNNLGTVLKDLGQVQTAIEHFKCALALQPNYADCFSNLLFCMTHAEHIDNAALMQAHQAYADLYEAPLKAAWLPHQNTRDVHRPLNIGWVSADFRAHSVAHFMLPLLSELAKETSLRLVAYANQPLVDNVTTQMQGYFSTWYEVSSWSDQALAEQIRADGIDILIDLSGHTSGNRLLTFARKPAPVQLSWLGYLNTTGLSSMDYYLADSYLLPPGQFDDQFTEKLVQLPVNATFIPYEQAPEVNALPALNNGYVTFACFNRVLKITQSTVQQWAALMQALPDSRLVIGGVGEGESTQHLQTWFAEAGIAANRIRYYARTDMASYLGYYHEVDICLDTFPSNGVTTTAHALWMGVPTLCVEGDRPASRGAMALMQHLGLHDWVSAHQGHFVTQGLALCSDVSALAVLRSGLRSRFSSSALADAQVLSNAFTRALHGMWASFCNDISPASFCVAEMDAPLSLPVNAKPLTQGKEQMSVIVAEASTTSLRTPEFKAAQSANISVAANVAPVKIYQAYYSEQSRLALDKGFIPFDNLANPRPDWREYWFMRQYLLNEPLDEDTFYGFFSPKFSEKTGLSSAEVYRFIQANADQADLILFSPFFDQTAFFLNQFLQGILAHQGIEPCFKLVINKIAPEADIDTLIMHSDNSVYSNYFVAKPKFWRAWLATCEELFHEAELGKTLLAQFLNADTTHENRLLPCKSFVFERIVSLMLATQPQWRVKAYDSSLMPLVNSTLAAFVSMDEFKTLNEMKKQASKQRCDVEILGYSALRTQILDRVGRDRLHKLEKAIEDIYVQAQQLQAAGDLQKASKLYADILKNQPQHAGANHQLGFIETHTIGVETALPKFEIAVLARPDVEQYWVSLIDAYLLTRKFVAAEKAIGEAQKHALSPSMAAILSQDLLQQREAASFSEPKTQSASTGNNTFNTTQELEVSMTVDYIVNEPSQKVTTSSVEQWFETALALQAEDKLAEAAIIYEQIIQISPLHAGANHQLGGMEVNTKGLEDTLSRFEIAVTQQPEVEQYWVSYIDALVLIGVTDLAKSAIKYGQQFGLTAQMAAVLLSEIEAMPCVFNSLYPHLKAAENNLVTSEEETIYLHLGCGNRKFDGFINIDAEPDADLQLDLTKPLPWLQNSVDGIYSEHFFEHISQAQAVSLLHECRRVLKPGGVLRIAMPDLMAIIADYQANNISSDWNRFGLDWTHNRCERLNIAMRWWGHQWIYDEEELIRLGRKVGLESIGRYPFGESSIEMFKHREHRESSELIVEFRKPNRRLASDALPLVTIAIPSYNPTYFAEALQSALAQTYENIEIVICDDCPTSAIEDIVQQMADSKFPIRYFKNPPQTGQSDHGRQNYIRCLHEAQGEFVKYLNDDDLLADNCIAHMVDCFRTYEEVVLVTSKRDIINQDGMLQNDITATTSPVNKTTLIEGLSLGTSLLKSKINFVGEPTTALFRKADLIDNLPDMFSVDGKQFHSLGDVLMWLHLSSKGNVVYVTSPLSYFRRHAEQVQVKYQDELTARDGLTWPAMAYSWQRLGLIRA